jgi:hypothetical protein
LLHSIPLPDFPGSHSSLINEPGELIHHFRQGDPELQGQVLQLLIATQFQNHRCETAGAGQQDLQSILLLGELGRDPSASPQIAHLAYRALMFAGGRLQPSNPALATRSGADTNRAYALGKAARILVEQHLGAAEVQLFFGSAQASVFGTATPPADPPEVRQGALAVIYTLGADPNAPAATPKRLARSWVVS